jgi:hypothetical protein
MINCKQIDAKNNNYLKGEHFWTLATTIRKLVYKTKIDILLTENKYKIIYMSCLNRKKTITIRILWTKFVTSPTSFATRFAFFTTASWRTQTWSRKIFFSFRQIGKFATITKRYLLLSLKYQKIFTFSVIIVTSIQFFKSNLI